VWPKTRPTSESGICAPTIWLLRFLRIAGFETGIAEVVALPLWIRIFAVLTAGVVEDGLFLGFAFTRLKSLTGSYWLAGGLSVPVISLLHLPHWGVGPVLIYLVTTTLAIGFFIWRKDLLANMIGHIITDGMAFIITPAIS
jgi:hypothetical protein